MDPYRTYEAGPLTQTREVPRLAMNMDVEMHHQPYMVEDLLDISPSEQVHPHAAANELYYSRPDYANTTANYSNQYLEQWSNNAMAQQQSNSHPHHLSGLSVSTTSSGIRFSGESMFSHNPARDSDMSDISFTSQISNPSRTFYREQTEIMLTNPRSAHSSLAPSPVERPHSVPARRRSNQRQSLQEKDYFKTCVSAHKQSRPCKKEQKYFCTICKKLFVEKADWKRHEETYQERREQFQCDLCGAIYFLDKDFVTHHTHKHRCDPCRENMPCSEKPHVKHAKKDRTRRTGWGCGFCCHFTTSWTERCNHIAHHVEKEGKTPRDWHHSRVIHSLLQRETILSAWNALLASKHEKYVGFGWNEHSTGRVEGYPDNGKVPQLQDMLEYFRAGYHDAEKLVTVVFEKATVKQTASEEREEEDDDDWDTPPAVPPKDSITAEYRDLEWEALLSETQSWNNMADTILSDVAMPSHVTHSGHWHAGQY